MKIRKLLIGAAFVIMSVAKVSAENPCGLSDSAYKNLIEKTIVSTGNNYRMKKVLSKIKSGEKVYIAAIGGSVTEEPALQNSQMVMHISSSVHSKQSMHRAMEKIFTLMMPV